MKIRECVAYFKGTPGFDRLLGEMRKKVRSYGRVGGTVVLKELSSEERRSIESLFGESLTSEGQPVSIPLKRVEEALQRTKFAGVSLKELLEGYFDEELISNKEMKQRRSELRREESKRLDAEVDRVFGRLNELPEGGHIRLAVLAMDVFGDPHALDAGTVFGDRLVERLYEREFEDGIRAERKRTAKDRLEVLLRAGIRPDDISSFVTLYGIVLWDEAGEHPAYRVHVDRGDIFLVSLSNLSDIVRVVPRKKQVYVIENQMVFSELCERCPGASLVCTSGQPSVAALLVLDLLCREECEIYYSGDTDPEGLQIADRLVRRSNGRIRPWHMGVEDYEASLSSKVIREERRLHRMDGITDVGLTEVCERIRKSGRVGYQEALLEVMAGEISAPGTKPISRSAPS